MNELVAEGIRMDSGADGSLPIWCRQRYPVPCDCKSCFFYHKNIQNVKRKRANVMTTEVRKTQVKKRKAQVKKRLSSMPDGRARLETYAMDAVHPPLTVHLRIATFIAIPFYIYIYVSIVLSIYLFIYTYPYPYLYLYRHPNQGPAPHLR